MHLQLAPVASFENEFSRVKLLHAQQINNDLDKNDSHEILLLFQQLNSKWQLWNFKSFFIFL